MVYFLYFQNFGKYFLEVYLVSLKTSCKQWISKNAYTFIFSVENAFVILTVFDFPSNH